MRMVAEIVGPIDNVVDICSGCSAYLASIIIAFYDTVADAFPCYTGIGRMTALPKRTEGSGVRSAEVAPIAFSGSHCLSVNFRIAKGIRILLRMSGAILSITLIITEYTACLRRPTKIDLPAVGAFDGNLVLPGPGSILCHVELRTLPGAKVMGDYLITAPRNSFYNSTCFAAKGYSLAILAPLFLSCSQCLAAYYARMARGFKLLWHINLLVGYWSLRGASRTRVWNCQQGISSLKPGGIIP